MIIKDNKNISGHNRMSLSFLKWLIPLILIGIIVKVAITVFKKSETTESIILFECDLEKKVDDAFICGDQQARNGHTYSKVKARSGKASSYIDRNSQYGIAYVYDKVESLKRYRVSMWRNTDSPDQTYLAVKADNEGSKFYMQTNKSFQKKEDGWELLELTFQAPKDGSLKAFKVYTYLHGDLSNAYFDDLKVEILPKEEKKSQLSSIAMLPSISLYLDDKALSKIKKKRKEALDVGLLRTTEDDWVKAKILLDKDKELTVNLRLKGDWTDHLKGEDWSYRINTKSDESWNRMQSFSLQHPGTRYYLNEWVFHKMLEGADVLSPRFDFIELKLNGSEEKLYAYEEHFAKQLVEYKNRREGVILKFSEDVIWDQRYRDNLYDINSSSKTPLKSREADVAVFKENKTYKNPVLRDQFEQAKNLLHAYQFALQPVDNIFDLEKVAKYYAIVEVMQAYHSLVWHNQRFYYNPFIKKLEPIGYDGFTEDGVFKFHNKVFFGAYFSKEDTNINAIYYNQLFRNPEFSKFYAKALKEYSSEEFLDKFFETESDEIDARLALIQKHVPTYKFNKNEIYKNARLIANTLDPLNDKTVKAYRSDCTSENCTIQVASQHHLPLLFLGSGFNNKEIVTKGGQEFIVSNSPNFKPKFIEVTVPKNHEYIFYKVAGLEEIYACAIGKWSSPKLPENISKSLQIPLIADKDYLIEDKIIRLLPGEHTINKAMIIPADHTLFISANTTIDIIENGHIICYGDLQVKGLKDSPVHFKSSTKENQGIFVSQAAKRSSLEWVRFSDFNTLTSGTWRLTGAVNFYESDVTMRNVTIENNQCEDALNIVRSNFDIDKLNIDNTFADGFDADFCVGVLKNSQLSNTGNDAVDFSGSKIDIQNLTLTNIADKGISAGEESTLTVKSATIDKADIGIASKDLSKVTVRDVILKNCNKGFAAYRKKPEYGGGTIIVKNYSQENVKVLELADKESTIKLPSK